MPSVDEAGTYGVLGGFKIEVVREGERIAMRVPGQPTYPLEHVEGRRYRLGPPAPPGFFATFRARKDEPKRVEVWLEQPYGDIALAELSADEIAAAATAEPPPEQRELLGTYRARGDATEFQLAAVDGRVALARRQHVAQHAKQGRSQPVTQARQCHPAGVLVNDLHASS